MRRTDFANDKIIVIDDEKYFTDNIDESPDNGKYKTKAKFADKILVWCAISIREVSRPYVERVRSEALNSQRYIQNCLTKLDDFIHEYHVGDDIIFWPDLASCHYARDTENWLNDHNISFVPKKTQSP